MAGHLQLGGSAQTVITTSSQLCDLGQGLLPLCASAFSSINGGIHRVAVKIKRANHGYST